MAILKYAFPLKDGTYNWKPIESISIHPIDADTLQGYTANQFATATQGAKADSALPSKNYTASDILSKLLGVDGSGSKLDSDLLDGKEGVYFLDYNNLNNKPASYVLPFLYDFGSGTFNSSDGVTISHNDIGANTYKVFITIVGDTDGSIGEITVSSKASDSFVVKNTGSNTTNQFDWFLIK